MTKHFSFFLKSTSPEQRKKINETRVRYFEKSLGRLGHRLEKKERGKCEVVSLGSPAGRVAIIAAKFHYYPRIFWIRNDQQTAVESEGGNGSVKSGMCVQLES